MENKEQLWKKHNGAEGIFCDVHEEKEEAESFLCARGAFIDYAIHWTALLETCK